MALNFRKIIYTFLIIIFIILSIIYLLVCLTPYIPGDKYWLISFAGLGFPMMVAVLLIILLIYIIKRSKWALLPLFLLLIGWKQISVSYKLRFSSEFKVEKPDNVLRVLSWNVSKWDEPFMLNKGGKKNRENMLNMIQAYKADVLCLQEFFESPRSVDHKSNIKALNEMGFIYNYFVPRLNLWDSLYTGSMIASKYPIKDSASFENTSTHSEGMSYVDINAKGQTLRVMVAKLESVGFSGEDYANVEQVKSGNFSALGGIKTILSKFRYSYNIRYTQAKAAEDVVKKSPFPVILCAHLDDIPNSSSYFRIRGKLNDAFVEKGAGFGKTWSLLSPTLRISYIFQDPVFKVKQFTIVPAPFSDHYTLITDLGLPSSDK